MNLGVFRNRVLFFIVEKLGYNYSRRFSNKFDIYYVHLGYASSNEIKQDASLGYKSADQKVPGLMFSTQYRREIVNNIIACSSAVREL